MQVSRVHPLLVYHGSIHVSLADTSGSHDLPAHRAFAEESTQKGLVAHSRRYPFNSHFGLHRWGLEECCKHLDPEYRHTDVKILITHVGGRV